MRHCILRSVLLSCAFAALGLSAGLYYDVAYFGRSRVSLLEPIALGGAVLYYVLLPPGWEAPAQAWWWLVAHVVAGWLAYALLRRASRSGPAAAALLAGCAVLSLPAPWLAWRMADGLSPDRLWRAMAYREFDLNLPWLGALYGGLALLAAGVEAWLAWPRRAAVGGAPLR